MLIADLLTSENCAAVGLALLAAVLLKRVMSKSQASRQSDPQQQVRSQMRAAETSVGGIVRSMEVELHDYQREIEGRIETKLAVLNQLMEVADQEIDHLSHVLEDVHPQFASSHAIESEVEKQPTTRLFDVQQRRMIRSLLGAGFDMSEVARMLGCGTEEIQRNLDDDQQRRAG